MNPIPRQALLKPLRLLLLALAMLALCSACTTPRPPGKAPVLDPPTMPGLSESMPPEPGEPESVPRPPPATAEQPSDDQATVQQPRGSRPREDSGSGNVRATVNAEEARTAATDAEDEPAEREPSPAPPGHDDRSAPPDPGAPVPAAQERDSRSPAPAPGTPESSAPAPAAPAPSRVLRGRIELSSTGDRELEPGDRERTVVYFIPTTDFPAPEPEHFVISTRQKRFQPDVLAIPAGSTVEFPNRDVILHNVFSLSSSTPFDLGLYGPGESRRVRFEQPGLVYVHCNVHHAMQADILVMNTPWFTQPGADGRFTLEGLPDAGGNLYVWHPRGKTATQPVAAHQSEMPTVELALSRPRVPLHANKFGRSYRPAGDSSP